VKIWVGQHRDALRLAVHRLLATPTNTLLSLVAIGVALALPTGGQLAILNLQQLMPSATPSPQISVFLRLDANPDAAMKVKNTLEARPDIRAVEFISADKTLSRLKQVPELSAVIAALALNPFPHTFVVTPVDDHPEAMETLTLALRTLPSIEQVQLDSTWVKRLHAALALLRVALALIGVLLGAGLVAISFSTIRLQIMTRQSEVEVSRLLGATDGFIARPFYYFATLQGLLGGALAWLIVSGSVVLLREPVVHLARLYGVEFALLSFDASQTLLLLALAAGLGWVGGLLSVRQCMPRD
jgi:cell division transport system permease protein